MEPGFPLAHGTRGPGQHGDDRKVGVLEVDPLPHRVTRSDKHAPRLLAHVLTPRYVAVSGRDSPVGDPDTVPFELLSQRFVQDTAINPPAREDHNLASPLHGVHGLIDDFPALPAARQPQFRF